MKENLAHVLDTETVTAMDHVLVMQDGQTLSQPNQSVIVLLNVLETALGMEFVNVESATVTQDSNFSQIAHAKIVLNHVLNLKCVPAMENVPASQDSLDQTVLKRQTADPKLTVHHA